MSDHAESQRRRWLHANGSRPFCSSRYQDTSDAAMGPVSEDIASPQDDSLGSPSFTSGYYCRRATLTPLQDPVPITGDHPHRRKTASSRPMLHTPTSSGKDDGYATCRHLDAGPPQPHTSPPKPTDECDETIAVGAEAKGPHYQRGVVLLRTAPETSEDRVDGKPQTQLQKSQGFPLVMPGSLACLLPTLDGCPPVSSRLTTDEENRGSDCYRSTVALSSPEPTPQPQAVSVLSRSQICVTLADEASSDKSGNEEESDTSAILMTESRTNFAPLHITSSTLQCSVAPSPPSLVGEALHSLALTSDYTDCKSEATLIPRCSSTIETRGMNISYGCTTTAKQDRTQTLSLTPDFQKLAHTSEEQGDTLSRHFLLQYEVQLPVSPAPRTPNGQPRRLNFESSAEEEENPMLPSWTASPRPLPPRPPLPTLAESDAGGALCEAEATEDAVGTAELSPEAHALYVEACRAHTACMSTFYMELTALLTRADLLTTTNLYATCLSLRGPNFLADESLSGLSIAAQPPTSLPGSPLTGSPRQHQLAVHVSHQSAAPRPRLPLSVNACGRSFTSQQAAPTMAVAPTPVCSLAPLPHLCAWYMAGTVSAVEIEEMLAAAFAVALACHEKLLWHALFNVMYVTMVVQPCFPFLEKCARRMIGMRRDLYLRDTIELFVLTIPKAARLPKRPPPEKMKSSKRFFSSIRDTFLMLQQRRRTSASGHRLWKPQTQLLVEGRPNTARYHMFSGDVTNGAASMDATRKAPQSLPTVSAEQRPVRLPDITMEMISLHPLSGHERQPSVSVRKRAPRPPTDNNFTDIMNYPSR